MRKTTSFATEKSFEDIKIAINEITREVGGWSLKSIDDTAKLIKMSVTLNVASFGEDVEIAVQTNSAGTQNVTITSRPLVPTTLVDAGKNNHNLNVVKTYITTDDPAARQMVQKDPTIKKSLIISAVVLAVILIPLFFIMGMYMYTAL